MQVTLTVLYLLGGLALLERATASGSSGLADRQNGISEMDARFSGDAAAARRQADAARQQGEITSEQPLPWPRWQQLYLWGLVPLEVYCTFGHRLLCGALSSFNED